MGENSKPRVGRLGAVVRFFLVLGFMWIILSCVGGDKIIEQIEKADISFIALGVLSFTASIFTNTYRLGVLLNFHNSHVGYFRLLAINFVGLFFSLFLPGRTGGDVVRGYFLSKSSLELSKIIGTMMTWRFVGIFAMILIGWVSALLSYPTLKDATYVLFTTGLLCIFIAVVMVLVNGKLLNKFESANSAVQKKNRFGRIKGILKQAYHDTAVFKHQHRLLLFNTVLACVSNSLILGTWYFVSRAANWNISMWYILMFIPIISLLQMMPVSLNGIGVREGAAIVVFGSVGVVQESAVSVAMFFSGISILVSLSGGIVYAFYRHKRLTCGGCE